MKCGDLLQITGLFERDLFFISTRNYVKRHNSYFSDLDEFKMANMQARAVVKLLDELFQAYDKIVSLYNVLPLHRVGSSLLLASGVPDKNVDQCFRNCSGKLSSRIQLGIMHNACLTP